ATWLAAANNEAGDDILADTPGPCLVGVAMQDTLLIFKRASLYGVNYVGGDEIFSTRLLDAARGALTRRAAVDLGGRVFVVTDGDVMITDGTNWASVAQGRVRNHLFSQLDLENYEMLFVVHDRARNVVRIYYPTAGNTLCNEFIEYNVAEDTHAVLPCVDVTHAAVGIINDTAVDETWDADSGFWDDDDSAWNAANFSLATEQLVVASDSDSLQLQNSGDPVTAAASLSRDDLSMGQPERFKFVRRVHIRKADNAGNLYVRVGSRHSTDAAITWDAERTLAEGESYINTSVLG